MTDTTIGDPTSVDTTNDNNTNLPRFRKAYTQLLGMIRQVPEADYAPINLDPMTVVYAVEGVLPRVGPFRATIVEELPKFEIQYFDNLESYALALGHANTVHSNSMKPSPVLQALNEKAVPMREILVEEATLLIKRGLLSATLLDNLQGPNGYKNVAADLFLVADKLRANFDAISKRTSLTLAELDEAENLADQMSHEIGLKRQTPEVQAQAARDRQAAYTLAVKAYDQVRAALTYVRRDYDDTDEIMPSLYAGRNNSNIKKKDTPVPNPGTTPTTTPQPGTEPHPTGNAPTATPANAPSNVNATPTAAGSDGKSYANTLADNGPFLR